MVWEGWVVVVVEGWAGRVSGRDVIVVGRRATGLVLFNGGGGCAVNGESRLLGGRRMLYVQAFDTREIGVYVRERSDIRRKDVGCLRADIEKA